MQCAAVNINAKIHQVLIINGEGIHKIIDAAIILTPNFKDDLLKS